MKINEGKILLLLSGVLSGIVLISFLGSGKFNRTIFLSYKDYQEKKSEQVNLKNEINTLYKNLAVVDEKLYKYQSDEDKNKAIYEGLKEELKKLQLEYGTTEVTGPGITVTLRDRTFYLNDFDEQLQENLIHNFDIANIVQDLINAGAEAVSINGKRYVTNMAVTCVGPIMGLRLGDKEEIISPDFVVEAIGDSEALYKYLDDTESWYQILKYRQLPISKEKKSKIIMAPIEEYREPEIMIKKR